jgi:hypothetical protein
VKNLFQSLPSHATCTATTRESQKADEEAQGAQSDSLRGFGETLKSVEGEVKAVREQQSRWGLYKLGTSFDSYWLKVQTPLYNSQSYVSVYPHPGSS